MALFPTENEEMDEELISTINGVQKGFFTGRQKQTLKHNGRLLLIGFVIGIVLTLLAGLWLGARIRAAKAAAEPVPTEVPHVLVVEDGEKEEWALTVEYVEKKLENLSELSTAQMLYAGLVTVEEGRIPLITRKGFSMAYRGEMKAGIDLSQMQIDVSNDKVTVILPDAKVTVAHVAPETIQFFDEKKALFNWSEKNDVTEAIAMAEQDMAANADAHGLIGWANERAELIVKALLQDVVGERTINVMHSGAK